MSSSTKTRLTPHIRKLKNLVKLELIKPQAVMFASSLRNYPDKDEPTSKLKPRLKSASSVSRVQEVFNKSVVLANKKGKVRAKSATLPARYNDKRNRFSQETSVACTEPKIWPPIIKTHADNRTLTAIPFASQPVHRLVDFNRSMDYVTEELGKSKINNKDDQLKLAVTSEKQTKVRYYTYDSDVDSQEDGYELLESVEDLRDEGVERIDLPPPSNRIIPSTTYNLLQQKTIRVVHRDSSTYISCPQCHTHVAIPQFSPRSEIEPKSSSFSTPAARTSPQPVWQASHAIELTVPKMRSTIPSPTLSLPLDKKIYYRSTESSFNTDEEISSTDQFLSAHSRPRPLSASFYCKKI